MNAPCGQEDCDCGHTIERLVAALEAAQWRGGEPGADYGPVCVRGARAGHARQGCKAKSSEFQFLRRRFDSHY